MAASVQCRPQERSLGMMMKEVDEDLALFLEMRTREREKNDILAIQKCDEFDDLTALIPDSSFMLNTTASEAALEAPSENILNSEDDKGDDDWLLVSSAAAFPPSIEMEAQDTVATQSEISNAPQSEPVNPQEPASLDNTPAQPSVPGNVNSSCAQNRKPSLSGVRKTASRPATPTGRPSLPASSKPSRSSTPTFRGASSSGKAVAPVRSSTPTRVTARSSTPTARPTMPATSKPTSRSVTPNHRPSTRSSTSTTSAPGKSSSVAKTGGTTLKNSAPSRGTSPAIKSRTLKTSEAPASSNRNPLNQKTEVPKRPSSTSRGRPTVPSARSSNGETLSGGKPRRQSCSPLRGWALNGSASNGGSTVLSRSRGHANDGDDVNPVLIGSKMVERVVNMRKLAPPKVENQPSNDSASRKLSLSQDNSGFGRSLSKKSLDMAIRHMDIGRSINAGSLRPLVTSVKSGSAKKRISSASDSPLATSSNTSSESSLKNNTQSLDSN